VHSVPAVIRGNLTVSNMNKATRKESQHSSAGHHEETSTSTNSTDAESAAETQMVTIHVEEDAAGLRLDVHLPSQVPHMSRHKAQGLIKDGHVTVNGSVKTKARYVVKVHDVIVCGIPPPPPVEAIPEDIPLEVVYEDSHLLVVNKQAHLVVHPAPGNYTGTLVNALLHHLQLPAVTVTLGNQLPKGLVEVSDNDDDGDVGEDGDLAAVGISNTVTGSRHPDEHTRGGTKDEVPNDSESRKGGDQPVVIRPGIVHRLDKGTSGLMVIAKDDRTHNGLCDQFAARTVKRAYVAITCGAPDPSRGRVEAPIGRHSRDRKKMAVVDLSSPGARHAASKYMTWEELAGGGAALVEWRLETGRTHQIRVHARHIGHPLLGDETYGGGAAAAASAIGRGGKYIKPNEVRRLVNSVLQRPALHALTLGFIHPVTGEELYFKSKPPEDFKSAVDTLRNANPD